MIRVLHVCAGNLFGGVETQLVNLVRLRDLCPLMDTEFAVCFEGDLAGKLKELGARVHVLGPVRTRNIVGMMRARARLGRVLSSGRFDATVCHSPWSQAIFGSVVRRSGGRLVFWLHDIVSGRHWLERWARKTRPDLAICSSPITIDCLKRMYPRVLSLMIYYAVQLPPTLKSESREQLRASFNLNHDTVVIVQTSRLEEWKGQSLHLQALGRLSDVPNWVAWLVGGPQRPKEEAYLKRLKESAQRLGIADRVHFLGQRSDVPRLLRAADIHCQPNLGPEPFGITFIEAMQSGLPLVSTAIGAAATLIDDSCGILVPERDLEALEVGLRRLILDPSLRRRLGAGGPARARLFCDPATQLPLLYQGISRIISDPGSLSFAEGTGC